MVEKDLKKHRVNKVDGKLSMIDEIAMEVCSMLFWDLGESFSKLICQHKMQVKATGLIGVEADEISARKDFAKYTTKDELLGKSKFTTFEVTFDADD